MMLLIRHGKTEANEKHLYCGSTDLPLSANGRAELERKRDALGLGGKEQTGGALTGAEQINIFDSLGNCRFLTSGMLRTEQTLQILFGNVPFETDARFREMDFGIFEMHSYEELKDRPEYQVWITGNNEANICPGGESGVQMRERVLEGLRDLMGQPEANAAPETEMVSETEAVSEPEMVVMVTHGGTIAIIMEALFPGEDRNRYSWQPAPGGGYLIEGDSYRVI